MRGSRYAALVAGAAGVLLAATACGSGSNSNSASGSASGGAKSPSDKSLSIAYANITSANASLAGVAKLIASAGQTAGDKVKLYDNNADPTTATSVAQIMVNSKPDVIMDWSPAPQIGASLNAIFKRGNVPCIAVDIEIGDCSLFYPDNDTLGTNAGNEMAAQMKAKGWNGSNTTFVIAQNATVGDENNALERSAYLSVAKALPGFPTPALSGITATTTKLSDSAVQVNTGDELDTAYAAMKTALQTIPSGRHIVVYGITDESTLGAWRALSQAGRTDVLLGGNGGDPTGLSNLRTLSQWAVESSPFVPQWGEYLMAMAHAAASGVTLPAKTASPMAVITKKNVDDYYKPGGADVKQLPALSADSQYLSATGVLQKFGNVTGLG